MRDETDRSRDVGIADDPVLQVVFVCTGNQLRSPVAAAEFRAAAGGAAVDVYSYGTQAADATRVASWAHDAAAAAGVDLSGHRQMPIGGQDLGDADLVVGFERKHISRAVLDAGAIRARAFTLGELVGRLEQARRLPLWTPDLRAPERIALAHSLRLRQPELPSEILDPAALSRRKAARLAREVSRLSRSLAVLLFR